MFIVLYYTLFLIYSFLTLFINSNFEVGEGLWEYLAETLENLGSFNLKREMTTKDVLRISDHLENSS